MFRASQTTLERTRTSSTYQKRLQAGLTLFQSWLCLVALSETWCTTVELANQSLVEFIQHLYNTSQAHYLARHAILAVEINWPFLRGKLIRAWQSLKSWKLQMKSKSRVPIPFLLLQSLVIKALDLGLNGGRFAHYYFCISVLLRVGFYGLLRPGELFALRCGHVQLINTKGELVVVLSIIKPKTRASFGRSQYVLIRDPPTVAWVRWLIRDLHSNTKLWPSDGPCFRKVLKAVLSGLNLGENTITPAGMRSGGASNLLLLGTDTGTIKHQGRWASQRSLEVYLQESMALMVLAQLGNKSERKLSQLVTVCQDIWQSPFTDPWIKFFKRRQSCHLKD